MRAKDLFIDIRDGKLTTLDKISALETITDGYDSVKLKQLHEDLKAFLKNTLRKADTDVLHVFTGSMYEAIERSNQNNAHLASITKEQFVRFLADNGSDLKINPTLLKRAVEIGLKKHGDTFDRDLADFLELKMFEKMVDDKIQESNKTHETVNPVLQAKSDSPYSLDDTKSWFLELCEDPDYQRHDGSPYLTAIDAELRKRHSNIVGQTPSETTIKNHRRKLGFMQK